jgi:hypothetical protein
MAPLLLLYVLRVKRERRIVPSTWLWQAALRDLSAKTPFRRLVPTLPLLLQLSVLALLALAVAGPVMRSARLKGPRAVVIVDVSASMGTLESGGKTRLDLARSAASSALTRLDPGTEVMVLAAAREPELISPFERDPARVDAALARVQVREVEGQLGRALALGSDQLRQRGGGRLVLVTDGAIADAKNLVAPGLPLELITVGTSKANTAIVRSEVTRLPDPVTGRERVEVFALIANQGAARDVFVTLSERNIVEPLASRKLSLGAGERAPVALAFDAVAGDIGQGLEIELSPHDALPSDDRATARVPSGQRLDVVVAPRDASSWLLRALGTDPNVELYRTDVAGLAADAVPNDALVVLDGACPARIPGSDLLIVNPPPGNCRNVTVGPELEQPLITSWSTADPRFRFLSFEGVQLAKSRNLSVDSPRLALVHARDGVVVADVSSPGRSGTLIGFDVGDSNWPLRASFVLFMRNVVELARSHRLGGPTASARTGEPISVRVPQDVDAVEAEYPDGHRERLRARDGVAVLPAPNRIGSVQVSWQGARPGSTLIPANLASEAESRNVASELKLAGSSAAPHSAPQGQTSFDWLFGALALLLIAADVAYFTRRPRPGAFQPSPPAPRTAIARGAR